MARRVRREHVLTDLEMGVMRVVWDAQRPVTVREVLEGVNAGRDPALAYNTVQTMLQILKGKGVVRSRPGPKKAHLFTPCLSRDQVATRMVGDLADRLFDGERKPLLLQLIDDEQMSREELEQLRGWVDERLGKRGTD